MRLLRVVLVLLAAIAAAGCGREAERPRSILLVSMDTVRADRIGCYGRGDAGTPTIDSLAERGVRFADAMAPSPTTAATHATLLSGLDPLRHRVRNNGTFALSSDVVTLAERLSEAGFRTGGFVGSIVLAKRYGLDQGFETYTWPRPGPTAALFYVRERTAWEVNDDALQWLDTTDQDPFFLFVHYMEPHAPYVPPQPERERFAGDRYQGEIAATDRALGELLSGLDERGRLDDTLVVVVSDHGESLGEHGELTHGIFLYQATLHVPFVAAGPGVAMGLVVDEPVGLADVTPTLLEAAGFRPGDGIDGRSLWVAAQGGAPPAGRGIYAETFVPRYENGWSELRALRRGPLKYIEAPRPELYSLERDRGELSDLVASEGATAETMRAQLADLVTSREREGHEPERVTLSQREREALEALGYVAGSGGDAGDVTLPDPKDRIAYVGTLAEAEELVRVGKVDEAEALLRRLIADSPAHLAARVRLVQAFVLADRIDDAIAEGRALDEVARGVPDGARIAAQAHLLLSQIYLDHSRLEDAIRELELAFAAPQPAETYNLLAAVYHDVGRDDQATRVLREAVERELATDRTWQMLRTLERISP